MCCVNQLLISFLYCIFVLKTDKSCEKYFIVKIHCGHKRSTGISASVINNYLILYVMLFNL
jgi:hypothetical protein